MPLFSFLPILFVLIYLGIIAGILYLINIWVNRSVNVRKDQNELLRELIQKMDKPGDTPR